MYKKIIVALGLSHGHGEAALKMARLLKDAEGQILAVHVLEPVPGFASLYLQPNHEQETRAAALKGVEDRIGDAKDAKALILSGHPGRTITDYAEEVGADLIITGSHKPDMQDMLLGSTAARVVRHAPCSVHVIR